MKSLVSILLLFAFLGCYFECASDFLKHAYGNGTSIGAVLHSNSYRKVSSEDSPLTPKQDQQPINAQMHHCHLDCGDFSLATTLEIGPIAQPESLAFGQLSKRPIQRAQREIFRPPASA